ncbi:MAG: hypothetical protein HQM15_06435 [Deltaproteobacteria bacterium]|nr:hypothetical protein [Deltaproteobacteria bacterium]
MKKTIAMSLGLLSLLASASLLRANEGLGRNKYVNSELNKNYWEDVDAVYDNPSHHRHHSKVQIIGVESTVPQRRILDNLKEGVTDQLTVLKLFSAPNIITRSPQDKETWVYNWIWSYQNEENPSQTTILMDQQGKRIRRNKKPVSLVITFNDKDIIESYAIKLIKAKKDTFSEF